jgi:DNA-binding protein
MLELKNEVFSQAEHEETKEIKIEVLIKLKKLEEVILKAKGKEREKAIETYRELLWLLKDEPIYFLRY